MVSVASYLEYDECLVRQLFAPAMEVNSSGFRPVSGEEYVEMHFRVDAGAVPESSSVWRSG
jgi:hypothetical protein